uniref:Uncharacterized protein n=1 Tax=Laticauda laticaudata TaxID=8630 RepID=A0A8C5WTH2_LATLA
MEVLRRSSVFAAEVMEVFDRTPTDKELVSQAKPICTASWLRAAFVGPLSIMYIC